MKKSDEVSALFDAHERAECRALGVLVIACVVLLGFATAVGFALRTCDSLPPQAVEVDE